MTNAKNQIKELLEAVGLPQRCAVYTSPPSELGVWTSTVVVTRPAAPPLSGTGTGRRKRHAEVAAAEDAMAKLPSDESTKGPDWALIYADAQVGDALLKLAGYLATGLASPGERSQWLQLNESDRALAKVFDRWLDAGDPDLTAYGRGLAEKHKSTLVEALVWRRYRDRVLGPAAMEALGELREALARM